MAQLMLVIQSNKNISYVHNTRLQHNNYAIIEQLTVTYIYIIINLTV